MTDAFADRDDTELAALVAAKLCHDVISPAGAVMQGVDLLDDPSAQDMRDDAIALIGQSARRLLAVVDFARVAWGAASSAEIFKSETLEKLTRDLTDGGRATLVWAVEPAELPKASARVLLNLAYLTMAALPSGGQATISARVEGDRLKIEGLAEGARARLKAEAVSGLNGRELEEGLPGQWVQPHWLWLAVRRMGGTLDVTAEEGRVVLSADLPA
jgi:histidine phosphotransferase ChpT